MLRTLPCHLPRQIVTVSYSTCIILINGRYGTAKQEAALELRKQIEIRRKIGIRKKNARKLRRKLKYNGLYRLCCIKTDPVLIFLLKIFGVLANICIFAHEIFKINNYGNTNKVHERAFAARIR